MPVPAKQMRGGNSMPFQGGFDMGELWRVGLWGMAAAAALLVAVFASSTERGNERLMRALSQGRDTAKAPAADSRRAFDEKEGQRLADAVRLMSADRDALLVRITALESSVRSISDSMMRVEQAVQAAQAPAPTPDSPGAAPMATTAAAQTVDVTATTPSPELTATTVAPFDVMAAVIPSFQPSLPLPTAKVPSAAPDAPQQATVDPPPEASAALSLETRPEGPATVTRTKLGLDIGTAKSLEGLRTLWRAAQRRHPTQLEGLHPIVHVRELSRPGGIQLRLVAGPIPTAAAAARLCAEIATNGTPCEPALFDGQRLALR